MFHFLLSFILLHRQYLWTMQNCLFYLWHSTHHKLMTRSCSVCCLYLWRLAVSGSLFTEICAYLGVEVCKYPFNTIVHPLMGFQCAPPPCSVAAIALCKSKYWILDILFNILLALDSCSWSICTDSICFWRKCDPIKERNCEIEKIMEVLNLCWAKSLSAEQNQTSQWRISLIAEANQRCWMERRGNYDSSVKCICWGKETLWGRKEYPKNPGRWLHGHLFSVPHLISMLNFDSVKRPLDMLL